jgi:3-hydroxybutyrate dehydrogenase
MKPLSNKVALITGSTSGIGLGIAHELARAGADIALNGLGDAATIARVVDEIKAHGVRAEYFDANMRDGGSTQGGIRAAERHFGTLDILVNNAGIQHVASVNDFPDEKWDDVIAINLSSSFHTMKAALPGMQARNFGRIINIASAHGLVASANKSAYVAAKHGLIGLTKVVALENARHNITCNAICPGWVLTPLVQAQIDARAKAQGISVAEAEKGLLAEKEPSLRFTTPAQIGQTTVFLCSDAAANMTGASLAHDGGWTAQ